MRSSRCCGAVPAGGGQSGVPGDRGDRSGRRTRRRTQRTAHDPPSSRSTFAFPRTEMKRILPLLLGALCGWGRDNSASPALPAVAPPPPAPAPSPPLVVGFLAGPDRDPGRGVHPGRSAVRRRYRSPFYLASPPDDSAPGRRRGRKRLAGRRGGGAAGGCFTGSVTEEPGRRATSRWSPSGPGKTVSPRGRRARGSVSPPRRTPRRASGLGSRFGTPLRDRRSKS